MAEPIDQEQVRDGINQKLSHLCYEESESSIFKLHSHLRNVNGKAYDPEIIAIGPYHRGKDNVKMMEKFKLIYLQKLLRCKSGFVQMCVSTISEMEKEVRSCYADPIGIDRLEFIEMLVLDGCFIVELVRKFDMEHIREENDPIFKRKWLFNCLLRDLLLFENQIPFFVLSTLFDLIEIPNQLERLVFLILRFFREVFPGEEGFKSSINMNLSSIKHLLELVHFSWLPEFNVLDFTEENTKEERNKSRFIDSATRLIEANVKFQTSQNVSLFDISFANGTMRMPLLVVEDRTESVFRNLIAYEQYFCKAESSYVTAYVTFLNCLIDSSEDVDILQHSGIIDNWLGDGQVVSNMFNKLTDSVTIPWKPFNYSKIFYSVNMHCNQRRNRWMAKLRHNYLNSPWGIISVVAAILLLLMTLIQTVFPVLQVVQ